MAGAGGLGLPRETGQRFQVLRCFSCGTFQVQQVKASRKWRCGACAAAQSLVQAYGRGSGPDCRRHVQKLNWLRAGAEAAAAAAAAGGSWYLKETLNKHKENIATQEENLSWQEEEVKVSPLVSRWNKYLAKDSEDQEEQVLTDREQLYSRERNIVEEQRKHKSRFHHNDVQENLEKKGNYGLTFQAKKIKTFESPKESTTEVEQDCGDYVRDSSVVPAINVFWVPQAPESAAVSTSKWEKFLLAPSCSKNDNVTPAVQKSSEMLEMEGAPAGKFLMSEGYPQQEEESPSPGTGAQTEKSFASSKHAAQKYISKLPSATPGANMQTAFDIGCAPIEDVLSGKQKDHLIRAGAGVAGTTESRLCFACPVMPTTCVSEDGGTFTSADPFGGSSGEPQLLHASNSHLFCTDEDFDDDL